MKYLPFRNVPHCLAHIKSACTAPNVRDSFSNNIHISHINPNLSKEDVAYL
jgi:hypothetical protein